MAEGARDFYRKELGKLIANLRIRADIATQEGLAQLLQPRRKSKTQQARRQTVSRLQGGELDPHPDFEVPYLLQNLPKTDQESKALMKALASAYVGSDITAVFQPPVLRDYPLAARLVDAIRPPIAEWHDPKTFWSNAELTSLNFSLFIGAVLSLLSCLELFAANPSLPHEIYDHTEVYSDLQSMVATTGTVDWHYGPHTTLLSIGYFLNKTASNLSAVLLHCTKAWLAGIEADTLSQLPFEERLESLKKGLGDSHLAYSFIAGLSQAVAAYIKNELAPPWAIDAAEEHIKLKYWQNAFTFTLNDLHVDYERLFTTVDERCVCVLLQLSNSGTIPRRGPGIVGPAILGRKRYIVDWIAAAKALLWIADFWRSMLRDLNARRIAGRS